MLEQNIEKIELFVEKLHSEMNVIGAPVQVEEIAQRLGMRIKRAPSDHFSGLLIRKDGKALIGLNSNESQVRQRFTMAHELGHYFLHEAKDVFVDYRDNQSGINRNPKEKSANAFAAAFLMPRKLIQEEIQKIAHKDIYESEIEELANKYEVSKDAMSYRILNLGLKSGNLKKI